MALSPLQPLTDGEVSLRVVRVGDARLLQRQLRENRDWLAPWEATYPTQSASVLPSVMDLRSNVRALRAQARAGLGVPFIIEFQGRPVGQLNISAISRGSVSSAVAGYWVERAAAGNNVTPRAVALATDYCFSTLGLHRMEICIRPENAPSLRVASKLGFRFEGLRRRYIHINGQWADHYCFALVREEVPEGVLQRLLTGRAPEHLAAIPADVQAKVGAPLGGGPR